MREPSNTAAIYCRLSREDGSESESNSITNQRQMLKKYAKSKGFSVYKEYIDDGYSGTNFDRPSFKQMIRDIEKGKLGIVLVKDMSRLGRHNALVAHYTEIFFPDHDIRFISVTEGIDTAEGENEMMAFKSVINEFYARDISKKTRSAKRMMALNGEYYGGYPPYGYKKDPENKRQLVIDDNTAPTVKRMFQLASQGMGTYQIAQVLKSENILMPRAYLAEQHNKYISKHTKNYPTAWHPRTIQDILTNRMYLGHMVLHKEESKSFKSKKVIQVPKEEWIEVQHRHAPIIEEHLFELVQRITSLKKKTAPLPVENIFRGLLRCPDCGCRLHYVRRTDYEGHEGGFYCCNYRGNTRKCSAHYIRFGHLEQLVRNDIRRHMKQAHLSVKTIMAQIQQLAEKNLNQRTKHLREKLGKFEKRQYELDFIIQKLFEQHVNGIFTEERVAFLSKSYEEEQKFLKEQIEKLHVQLDEEAKKVKVNRLHKIAKKMIEVPELTPSLLFQLIDCIYVYNAGGNPRKDRTQTIQIQYKFY